MNSKPGVRTSEFWLAAASLAAAICHALGFTNGVAGDVQTTVGGAALALITAWLGSNYIGSRLQLKSEDRYLPLRFDIKALEQRLRGVLQVRESDEASGGTTPSTPNETGTPPKSS